jgi:DNA-binding response OmpR family regulator
MAKKLLIVDDSPTELKLIIDVFSGPEYTIVTAHDGEEGVAKAGSEQPDLIILDVVMPKMNGFQACRTIKSTPELQNIPVILLTSKNQKSDEFWGKKQGADVYLTKPFDATELLNAVQGLLA